MGRHLLLLIFTVLSLFFGNTSFAETSPVDSPKEKEALPKWDTIPNMIHGFAEVASSPKFLGDERTDKDEFNLLEERFQLKAAYRPAKPEWLVSQNPEFFYKGDLLVDEYEEAVRYKIREAYGLVSPFSWMDVKLGRQILTWGTGDLLFINDAFPKNYESFFIGRDDEYLKVPSDAWKFSFASHWASADLVLIPFFTPDVSITGDRLSFYDNLLGRLVGEESDRLLTEPSFQPNNTQIAGRLYRDFGAYEVAAHVFKGYFNQPKGIKNADAKELFYPKLAIYGASIRGPVPFLGGITSGEVGYLDSLEDRSGKNRLIENATVKYLVGYERDFPKDLRLGVQYFAEQMLDFDEFKINSQSGDIPRDQFRQLLTLRITKLFWRQTLEASFFTFYSPTDSDTHFRPRLTWQTSDHWKFTVGANIFLGRHDWTEFGQLEDNDNLYMRLRYSF
ncbi:MAG: hypothetical protein A3A73_03440 [Omnitrophica bacterium RIFCSPLOWO2_01_FULL_50_24]|nr:MAG: hypothetical protein A3A73_03440 [Omnitrophica bacterium RIFCSPLOWO2_01_FULL_50_24]